MRARLLVVFVSAGACTDQIKAGEPYQLTTARHEQQLELTVIAGSGYHVNDDYPVTYEIEGAPKLQLKDSAKKTPCASESSHSCRASVSVPNETGMFAFSVCSAEKCLIEKVKVAAVR